MLFAFVFVSELVLVHGASVIAFRPEKTHTHCTHARTHAHTHNTHTHTHTTHAHSHTYTTEHKHTRTRTHTFTHSHIHTGSYTQDTPSALSMRAQRRHDLRVCIYVCALSNTRVVPGTNSPALVFAARPMMPGTKSWPGRNSAGLLPPPPRNPGTNSPAFAASMALLMGGGINAADDALYAKGRWPSSSAIGIIVCDNVLRHLHLPVFKASCESTLLNCS